MEALFKVGQTVRIAPRELNGSDYRFGYMSTMCKYSGRVVTITDRCAAVGLNAAPRKVSDDGYRYTIDLDGGFYAWASSMFISVEETPSKVTPTSSDEPISTEIHIHIKRDTKIKFNFKN